MKKHYLKVLMSFMVVTLLVSILSVNVVAGKKYEGVTLNVLCSTGWLAKVWHTDAQVWAKEQGATRVWNVETGKWEQAVVIHAASPLAWGWCVAIPKSSRHSEAAYDLMRYMVTGERAVHQAIWSDDGMDPYRISQFESKEVKEAYKEIPDFLPALKANIAIGIPDLRIPGTKEYYDVAPIYIAKALEGKMTPKEALDAVAAKWKSITQERGFDKQKRLYRESLGLTP